MTDHKITYLQILPYF